MIPYLSLEGSRLRSKLNAGSDADAIETVRGAGYMIRGE